MPIDEDGDYDIPGKDIIVFANAIKKKIPRYDVIYSPFERQQDANVLNISLEDFKGENNFDSLVKWCIEQIKNKGSK